MEKSFYKTLAHIAIPIMVQEFINSFVNILDTFMVGSLGVHEITAVGLANQVFFLFILFTFGINSGAAVLMGQFWGARELNSVKKTLGICLCGSILSGGIFSCLALFAPEVIMGVYSKDPKVIELGCEYLKIIWGAYMIVAITMPFGTALKSMGNTKIPMFTTMIALICNATLNYIFIFVFHMGVSGAALATVIARFFEMASIITFIHVLKLPIKSSFSQLFSADKRFILNYIIIGAPVLLNEFVWALGVSIYNVAYKFCGTDAQGALQIASSVQNLFMVIGMSLGLASGIMIANTLGANEVDKAIKYSRRFMKLSIISGIIMGVLLIAVSPLIVSVFNVTDDVKSIAIKLIIVFATVMAVRNFNFVTIVGVLRNGGDTWFCFFLDAAAVWLIGIPCAFLGAYFLGLPIYFVYILVTFEEILKLFVSSFRVLKNGWARKLV